MPWYFFNHQGVQDKPDLVGSFVATGVTFPTIRAMVGPSGSETQAKSAPSGYLFCNGATISNADTLYPDLHSYLNSIALNPYSVTATTFTLPDLRRRIPVCHNPGGPSYTTINSSGGSFTHSHSYTGDVHTHNISAAHEHAALGHVHGMSHEHTAGGHQHFGAANVVSANNADDAAASIQTHSYYGSPKYDINVTTTQHAHYSMSGASDSTAYSSTGALEPSNPNVTKPNTDVNIATPNTSLDTASVSSSGGPSSSTDTLSSIGNDSLPPYYSVNFIIKV